MPKIPEEKTPEQKPFLNLPNLKVWALVNNNKITGFKLIQDGAEKIFKVKKSGGESAIIDAFKQLEKSIK